MTWEHSDCVLVIPVDHTFYLVINKAALDRVMCSSYQIETKMNMYRDEVERVLSLRDLEDEYANSNNN